MNRLKDHVSKVRIPLGGDRVYKEECMFCFDNPESETGLYVCLNRFLGFSKDHVEQYSQRSGNKIFLHIQRIKKEIVKPRTEKPEASSQPKRLAIGVEGGFDVDAGKKYTIEEFNSIVVLPEFTKIPLPCDQLPDAIHMSVAGIIAAESASALEEAEALSGTWEGEKLKVSKHAENLLQLDNGIKIPPRGWKCAMCDKVDNLWLNLTDGSILCGRKFFDGTGGNNHAVEHYKEVGYPLAVKLGTITPEGGDVFSYDEDDMVEDPNLANHLAHFGINISAMKKTDKSMVELEIDINQRIGEWTLIQESDCQLMPVYGPGFTGLSNLGNSCYLNSVMQVVFSLPGFISRYVDDCQNIVSTSGFEDPASNFNVQMAKLGHGICSGRYSKPPPDREDVKDIEKCQPGIKPTSFKNLVGRGHPEFSTKRQQDAQEFFLHLINVIERNNRGHQNPIDCLKFQVQDRIECVGSKKVKYTDRTEYLLSLPIPVDSATNKKELEDYEALKAEKEAKQQRISPDEVVRAKIPFMSCLQSFMQTENVQDFYSSALKKKTQALKFTRLSSFPDYLMIHLKKFTVGEDWVPQKLDVSVNMPDEIDLASLRGSGLQPGEVQLPEEESSQQLEPELDMQTVSQLCDMGFPMNACKRAVHITGNVGVEPAMGWIMDHMNDSDFNADYAHPGAKKSSAKFTPNSETLSTIISMGFTSEQATKALKETDNNVERAVDWIFSHTEELDSFVAMETDQSESSDSCRSQYRDGTEKYRLMAFISHMGTSTMVGHYVCHIFKDSRWIIFNDNKVAASEKPPKEYGYIYLYKRK